MGARSPTGTPVLLLELRKVLKKVGDPEKAAAMQAYMKSAMPYHGVPVPALRKLCRTVFAEVSFDGASHWQGQVLDLWHNAGFREERYAALYLAADERARAYQTPGALQVYEELIVTGAWWDYVDDIAVHA
jgi:3-methyladenine DNA glycosylase AlkD